jgi:hypothetical protein
MYVDKANCSAKIKTQDTTPLPPASNKTAIEPARTLLEPINPAKLLLNLQETKERQKKRHVFVNGQK